MSIKVFLHTTLKRAELTTLLDSGATENFIDKEVAQRLNIPSRRLENPRPVYNVDGTPNRSGHITHYSDLELQTGPKKTNFRFFHTHLGEQTAILGYPWFTAIQPKINWAKGWIDETHLPLILRLIAAPPFRITEAMRAFIHTTIGAAAVDGLKEEEAKLRVPPQYQSYAKVFDDEAAARMPQHQTWDHEVVLKPDAPSKLPAKVYPLAQGEQKALEDFLAEQQRKGYIRPSKSPYTSLFFFIKKKDGTLRPVQDYRRLNEWTIRNQYPLPLIPELINKMRNAVLFTKIDIRWGYNNIRIKPGDEWKTAFITN